jgi:hypothetical protein
MNKISLTMNNSTRRDFISTAGKITLAGASGIFAINNTTAMTAKNMFIHHVYFWLKNPSSNEDRQKLINGLEKLSKVKTIKMFHLGKPADTNRDVIDTSYSISWLLIFDDKEAQESYQSDPIHLNFVDECKDLWQKVVVYDSVDAK